MHIRSFCVYSNSFGLLKICNLSKIAVVPFSFLHYMHIISVGLNYVVIKGIHLVTVLKYLCPILKLSATRVMKPYLLVLISMLFYLHIYSIFSTVGQFFLLFNFLVSVKPLKKVMLCYFHKPTRSRKYLPSHTHIVDLRISGMKGGPACSNMP